MFLQGILGQLRSFFYGATVFENEVAYRREHARYEELLLAMCFGDRVGVPVLPQFYSMRLLPYVVPVMKNWENKCAREKDVMDRIF